MQVIVKLTTNCNLACVYCSEGISAPKMLNINIFKKLVDDLPFLLSKYKQKEISILWHGGEPLTMSKEYLDEAMHYALTKLQEEYKVRFLMQTNGTLIDDDWLDLLKRYNVNVGVSLDGYQELHDSNRINKDGSPTFLKVTENIQKLRDKGIKVATLMVLNTKETVDIEKLWWFIKQYDLDTKIHPVIPCGMAADNKDELKIYANYVEMLKQIFLRSLEEDSEIVIEPINETMNAILGLAPLRECSYNGSCGQNFICLYPDGAIGFCGRKINDNEELIYGHLQEHTLLDLYESANAERLRNRQEFLKQNNCKNCAYWEFCHGGCSFEALNAFGTIEAKYPNCIARKELLHFFQTEGIAKLKERLLRAKRVYRKEIAEKENLLKELKNAQE